ncbi:hypothetical protein T4D_11425 [Trichinella pseudospiralis]|uniref:Uncharacterized protein n=1 Tax=Trichinella pseudospiralis TaxID=6337 RepID=A0A0V1FA01_TRIPS|nr:hypothetical protein T4D_11425 [Trichinella pseudospiralis]
MEFQTGNNDILLVYTTAVAKVVDIEPLGRWDYPRQGCAIFWLLEAAFSIFNAITAASNLYDSPYCDTISTRRAKSGFSLETISRIPASRLSFDSQVHNINYIQEMQSEGNGLKVFNGRRLENLPTNAFMPIPKAWNDVHGKKYFVAKNLFNLTSLFHGRTFSSARPEVAHP